MLHDAKKKKETTVYCQSKSLILGRMKLEKHCDIGLNLERGRCNYSFRCLKVEKASKKK